MFMSMSAAPRNLLAADGMLNVESILVLRKRIDTAINNYKPTVKYVKGTKAFPVKANVLLPVKTRKEANAVLKTLQAEQKESISEPKLTGDKGKFLLTFLATTSKEAKTAYEALSRTPGLAPSPEFYYVASRKAKTVKALASKMKAQDVNHMSKRAVKIAKRTRVSDSVIVLLPVFAKGVLPEFESQINDAQKAIVQHIKKAESTRVEVAKIRERNRSQRQSEYAELIDEVKGMFGGKVKDQNIVLGSSIAGQTLYVKLPSGKIMTVGLSNAQSFNKAKQSAEAAE